MSILLSIYSKVMSKTSSHSTDHDKLLVQSMTNTTIVQAGKLINIQCKVNLGNINNRISMLFETEETELQEGLENGDAIVSIKSGMNHHLKIPVINTSIQSKQQRDGSGRRAEKQRHDSS